MCQIQWDHRGLVPVVAQDDESGDILTLAWMNQEALRLTVEEERAVYWSRSRQQIWRKGESSGYKQRIKDIILDCDGDALILKVVQEGNIACHTGRHSCFFRTLSNKSWIVNQPVLRHPEEIYEQG